MGKLVIVGTLAFDAIETRWDNAAPNIKADVDAALGFTTTGAQATAIAKAWMLTKAETL